MARNRRRDLTVGMRHKDPYLKHCARMANGRDRRVAKHEIRIAISMRDHHA